MVNELIGAYTQAQVQAQEKYITEQREALGKNADYRIKALEDFSTTLPQEMRDDFASMVTSAKSVEILEHIINKGKGSAVAPQATQQAFDKDSLNKMLFAKDEHGNSLMSIDPEYKRKVDKMFNEAYGN
jgi:hypothetical protein